MHNHRGTCRRTLLAAGAGILSSAMLPRLAGASAPADRSNPGAGDPATPKQRWYPDYQERDRDIIDYQEFRVSGCDVKFRGPGFDPFAAKQGSFFSCIGAAQTYGCFYPKPYPTLVSAAIDMPVLNLAVGGAGPGFYPQYDALINAMNRGRFVVLQCMAARHESNSRFEADGYVEFVKDRKRGDSVNSGVAWRRIMDEERQNALRYVAETRASWIRSSRRLLDRLTVPVIFFWYSRRQPDYVIDEAAIAAQSRARAEGKDQSHFIDGLTGDFPHFVDGPTSRAVAELCEAKAECVSSRGMNQPIISQFTGKPVDPLPQYADQPEWQARRDGINRYYPSAEMHEDAAQALLPVVRKMTA